MPRPRIGAKKIPMRRVLLLLVAAIPFVSRAELPPSAYETMQRAAKEVIDIEVLRVEISSGDAPGRQNVHLLALVNRVGKSETGLKAGEFINIAYAITSHAKGWSGPAEIPVPAERDKSAAYLVKDAANDDYHPAAGAMSFRNF